MNTPTGGRRDKSTVHILVGKRMNYSIVERCIDDVKRILVAYNNYTYIFLLDLYVIISTDLIA